MMLLDMSLIFPPSLTHTQSKGLGKRPKNQGNLGLHFEATICESAWEISLHALDAQF